MYNGFCFWNYAADIVILTQVTQQTKMRLFKHLFNAYVQNISEFLKKNPVKFLCSESLSGKF